MEFAYLITKDDVIPLQTWCRQPIYKDLVQCLSLAETWVDRMVEGDRLES